MGQWQCLLLPASIITTHLDLDLKVPGESSASVYTPHPLISSATFRSATPLASAAQRHKTCSQKSAFLRAVHSHFLDTWCRVYARSIRRHSYKYKRMQAWSPAPFSRPLQRGKVPAGHDEHQTNKRSKLYEPLVRTSVPWDDASPKRTLRTEGENGEQGADGASQRKQGWS